MSIPDAREHPRPVEIPSEGDPVSRNTQFYSARLFPAKSTGAASQIRCYSNRVSLSRSTAAIAALKAFFAAENPGRAMRPLANGFRVAVTVDGSHELLL